MCMAMGMQAKEKKVKKERVKTAPVKELRVVPQIYALMQLKD